MRAYAIMKKYNIGIETLNDYLNLIGFEKIDFNTKIEDSDFEFICKMLESNCVKEYDDIIDNYYIKLYRARKKIRKEFTGKMPRYEDMCLLLKKYYFIKIKNEYKSTIDYFDLPVSDNYSEESFSYLYNNYVNFKLDELKEKHDGYCYYHDDESKKDYDYDYDDNVIDDESKIMSALRNGEGDKYGF